MKTTEFVVTSNVELLIALIHSLEAKDRAVPGLGLVFGEPGLGKTRTATWYADKVAAQVEKTRRPVFVRALANDTPRSFLERLVVQLGQAPRFRTSDLYLQAEMLFRDSPRLLIVDEIDRLASQWRSIETLRDLTDQTGIPILMIGMGESERKLAQFRHLYYRMKAHIMAFQPLSLADLQNFAEKVCEVKLDESAVGWIFEKTGGKIGEVIPELVTAEKVARANDYKEVKGTHLRRAA